MNKELYEKIINICLKHGCDYCDVYYEETINKNYIMVDSKLDDIVNKNKKGIGIRIYINKKVYYLSTNELEPNKIIENLNQILKNIKSCSKYNNKNIILGTEKIILNDIKIPHDKYDIKEKIKLLRKIDKKTREYSKYITQVRLGIFEGYRKYTIATSKGKFVTSDDIVTRIYCVPIASKNGRYEQTNKTYGKGMGYEFLENFNINEFTEENAKVAVKKLSAKKFKGGNVPVILGPGFGGVIFHEACGHALEATSVCEKLSIFSNSLNEKIASEKVTLIDDGTIKNEWGSTLVDTEGNKTQKNILIENGYLKSFLVDEINSREMNHSITSSSRRENYMYPPTSRMNNTYLNIGNDKIPDMIKSIDYGIYCKKLSGGSVDIKTGDFNFSADESYLIENGEIKDMLTGITLIGKCQEILKNIEMVSDDLKLDTGICGSESGQIYVTVGQPTIKVSEILVGGQE